MASIDINALIETAFDSSKYYMESLNLEKRVSINNAIPFYADLLRIKIIVNNLISNALKYCKKDFPEAYIEINIVVTEVKMVMEVSDNGIGINKEYLPNIFKMFYRATSAVTGSGLGLYIVKESIEKLGGSISVESEVDKGTKFIIELPNAYHSVHKPI